MHLRDQIQETRNIYKLSVDSKLDYNEKTARDDLYLSRRTINALASNLERLVEIHRSIVLAPRLEGSETVRQIVYQYLMEILYNHQRIFEYLLKDKPFDDGMMKAFTCREVQLEQEMMAMMKKMGGASAMLSMLPGAGKLKVNEGDIDEKKIERTKAIILSMTMQERNNPSIIDSKRKRRIASGSGTTVQDINQLLKQFEQTKMLMKQLKGGGMGRKGGKFRLPF